jgi:hypothetical protein
MTTILLAIINIFSPAPVIEAYPTTYTVNAGDFVLTYSGHFGEITAIATPYLDGVKMAYVEAIGWAGWVVEGEIAY